MKWAVIILSLLTAFFIGAAWFRKATLQSSEQHFDVAFYMLAAAIFGVIDFVLIIIWLAIT